MMSMMSITRLKKINRRMEKPFITISYEVGAAGVSVINGLFEYLQKHERRKDCSWRVFDKNLAKKALEDYNLPQSVLPYFAESTASEIEDIIQSTVGLHPSRFALVYEMNQTILRLAKSGYVIIVGRGSNMVTSRLSKGLHVRLIGSFEKRVDYLKKYLHIGDKEARGFIPEEDKSRKNYFKKYFDSNINDPLLYDLVINTDDLSIDDIVMAIGSFVV